MTLSPRPPESSLQLQVCCSAECPTLPPPARKAWGTKESALQSRQGGICSAAPRWLALWLCPGLSDRWLPQPLRLLLRVPERTGPRGAYLPYAGFSHPISLWFWNFPWRRGPGTQRVREGEDWGPPFRSRPAGPGGRRALWEVWPLSAWLCPATWCPDGFSVG